MSPDSEGYDLQKSKKKVSELYPVIKDAHGNVIDGFHRLEADPNWKTETLPDIKTPVNLALARIVANTHRRTISKEERKLQLVTLAEELVKDGMQKENVISWMAEITTFHPSYISHMLPAEYKIRPGAGGHTKRVALIATQDHEHVYDQGSTHCRICGKLLTVPESVKAGIGPVCAEGQAERFPGENAINKAMGIPPAPTEEKPKTQKQMAYELLDKLTIEFRGPPTRYFAVNQLQSRLHIYHPENVEIYEEWAKQLKKQEKPVEPTVPFKLVPAEEEENRALCPCPLCGKPGLKLVISSGVTAFAERLVTEGVLPIGLAEKVEEALRRRILFEPRAQEVTT